MKENVTLGEIAKELHVSITTVSRAISKKGRISEETKQKVMNYLNENQIQVNTSKAGYANKQTKNICITLPREEDYAQLPYFQKVLLSLYDYLLAYGYNIIPVKTSAFHISDLENIIRKHKVDGVILTRTVQKDPSIVYLMQEKVPFVVMGTYEDSHVYQVDVDQKNACRDLTNILIRMGIKKMAFFCANLKQTVTMDRYKGVLQAYQENELEFSDTHLYENTADPSITERIIESIAKEDYECIVCMDDNICVNAVHALRKNGIDIPSEMKVVSFYNSILLNGYYPPISCIDFNIPELAEVAGKLMLGILEQKKVPKRVLLGYNIVIKDSTN